MENIIDVIYDWIESIEAIIKRHTIVKPIIGEKGGEVSRGWIFEVITAISLTFKRHETKDGVLGFAYMTGLILLSWYFRTHFAKTCDPRRSIKDREEAFRQLVGNMESLFEMLKLEVTEKDKEVFDQEWEPIEFKKEETEND